jgi:protein-S-isoprenylcysteine O-methyltransferase Ste14
VWAIRFALFGIGIVQVGVSGYVLKHRTRYQGLLESGGVNLLLVIVYNALCYLMVGLPSDPGLPPAPPSPLLDPRTRAGLSLAGQVLMAMAASIMILTVCQRRALGGQNVEGGLLTSGIYRYARHPIYTGIVWMSLGFALASLNWHGLLMVPAVVLLNALQAVVEERYDVGVRFPIEYQTYRERARMFGPLWCWATLVVVLLAVGALSYWP